jgi:GNAT superfamily N-acetyltransferase
MLTICRATPSDVGEIMTVQRAAYVAEAQIYGVPTMPPLTETTEEIRAAVVGAGVVLVARNCGRLIGWLRSQMCDSMCMISRVSVAPDWQGRGVGSALLQEIEDIHRSDVQTMGLRVGERSNAARRLYERHGYREVERQPFLPYLTLVLMPKPLRAASMWLP